MNAYKRMIIEAAQEEAEENNQTPEVYITDRFQSEMGWNIERSGDYKAAKDWVQGLALNVEFYNSAIIAWGKKNKLLRKNASELSEDNFIENYWIRLAIEVAKIYRENRVIQPS